MSVKYPHVTVPLVGEDGNGGMIIGRVRRALRKAGVPPLEIEAFTREATSGDYDHLLQTVTTTVEVE